MKGNKVVTAVYTYLDDTLKGIHLAKDSGWSYKVYSPCPNHEIEELADPDKSPVRFVTFTGAITGLICGFGLAVWTSMDYPLRVSAKDIVAPPSFVVCGYEWTILFGALSTLFAMFFFAKFPTIFRSPGYDPRFSQTKFGVVVGCDSDDVDIIKERLVATGAEEVNVSEGL